MHSTTPSYRRMGWVCKPHVSQEAHVRKEGRDGWRKAEKTGKEKEQERGWEAEVSVGRKENLEEERTVDLFPMTALICQC